MTSKFYTLAEKTLDDLGSIDDSSSRVAWLAAVIREEVAQECEAAANHPDQCTYAQHKRNELLGRAAAIRRGEI